MNAKTVGSVCTPIRRKRLLMGYSIAEMAECLGLKKATYQCYDDGSRKAPDWVLDRMKQEHDKDRQFMRGIAKRIDAALKGQMILSKPAWENE